MPIANVIRYRTFNRSLHVFIVIEYWINLSGIRYWVSPKDEKHCSAETIVIYVNNPKIHFTMQHVEFWDFVITFIFLDHLQGGRFSFSDLMLSSTESLLASEFSSRLYDLFNKTWSISHLVLNSGVEFDLSDDFGESIKSSN